MLHAAHLHARHSRHEHGSIPSEIEIPGAKEDKYSPWLRSTPRTWWAHGQTDMTDSLADSTVRLIRIKYKEHFTRVFASLVWTIAGFQISGQINIHCSIRIPDLIKICKRASHKQV